jgi:hypothetical protein
MTLTRRQRLTRAGLVASAAAIAVVLAAALLSRAGSAPDGNGDPGGPPSPELAGQRVVTSYLLEGQQFVLDPSTGRYRSLDASGAVVSPDLRLVAAHHEDGVLVVSTTDGSSRVIPVPEPISTVIDHRLAWSPDSSMIAVTTPYEVTAPEWPRHHAATADGDGGVLTPFYRLVLVDVAAGTSSLINLGLPRWYHSYGTSRTGRIGAFGGAPVWLDDTHLAAPVTSLPPEPDEIVNGDTVGVFDLTGALVRETSLPDEDLAELRGLPPTHRLSLADLTPDGAFLLLGPVSDATIAVRGLPDPEAGGDGFAWRFELPAPADAAMWMPHARGWLSGTEVLVQADRVPIPGSGGGVTGESPWLRVVDVRTGEVRPMERVVLPDRRALPLAIGDAVWLSPEAAHLAFAP